MGTCSFLIYLLCGLAVVSARCRSEYFKCRDGTCIEKSKQCNGQAECTDWSDETLTACRGVYRSLLNVVLACGNPTVRAYDDVCPASCAANAVECGLSLFANTVRSSTFNAPSCSYSSSFPNGGVSVNGEIDLATMKAAHGSNLRFSCNEPYELVGKSKVFCQSGQWSDDFPTCVRSSTNRCILPHPPDHGQYKVPTKSDARPGEHFDNVAMYFACDVGYRLLGVNTIMCHHGNWTAEFPKCQKLCKLNPHVSVDYFCDIVEYNITFGSRPCGQYEPEGTVVRPQCRSPNYYHTGMLNFMHCIDGNWDYVAVCDPECGTVTPNGQDLQIGGEPAKHGDLPWHAGIYDKRVAPYLQICGGSLVSTTIVISAAHCFWNEGMQALYPASRFAVALGKIYRPWDNDHDTSPQKFDVKEIKVTPHFHGLVNLYQDDIALVVLDRPAEYRNHVRPVCVDFDVNFDRRQLEVGKKGKVAGWGLTRGTLHSEAKVLQVLELPTVSIASCMSKVPTDFRQYISGDKFCAGYWNGGKALCRGDSGGGLAFAEPERGSVRYYLRGVTSTAARDPTAECNAQTVSTFTQISRHEHFIRQYLLL